MEPLAGEHTLPFDAELKVAMDLFAGILTRVQ